MITGSTRKLWTQKRIKMARMIRTAKKTNPIPARRRLRPRVVLEPLLISSNSSEPSVNSKYKPLPPSPEKTKEKETPQRFIMREGEDIVDFIHYVRKCVRKDLQVVHGPFVHPAYVVDAILKQIPPQPKWKILLECLDDVLVDGEPNLGRHGAGENWLLSTDNLMDLFERVELDFPDLDMPDLEYIPPKPKDKEDTKEEEDPEEDLNWRDGDDD